MIIKASSVDIDDTMTRGKRKLPRTELYPTFVNINKLSVENPAEFPPYFFCTGRQVPFVECLCCDVGVVEEILGKENENGPRIWPLHVSEYGNLLYNSVRDEIYETPEISKEVVKRFPEIKDVIEEKVPGAKRAMGVEKVAGFLHPGNMPIEEFYELAVAIVENDFGMKVIGKDRVGNGDIYITHSKCCVDMMSPKVSKTSGVTNSANDYGISLSEICGIGDSPNDWPVLKYIGFPACPSNADAETKKLVTEKGGYVSQKPDLDGVIDIFQEIHNRNCEEFGSESMDFRILKEMKSK